VDLEEIRPFPALWDASMVSTLRSCRQKFFLEYIQNYKPRQLSHHIHAGGAFAAGLEAARRAFWQDSLPSQEALRAGLRALMAHYGDFQPPEDSPKSLSRMCGALEHYFQIWPLDMDPARPAKLGDRLGIEFSFAHPLPTMHPVSGEPLIYCGRADQIVEFAGGTFVEDDKTASQLGASWSRQWDLRSQFTGYCWAAREAGIPADGVLVRGISILKQSYGTAESISYRPAWQIERWLGQVTRDIEGAIRCWRDGYWDWALDHACSEYGGCTFRQICLTQHPDEFLELNFERRYWNPLLRTDTVLA
jgi:hypothetical protein